MLAPGASAGANGGPVSANSIQTILFQWVTYGAGKFVAVGRADSNVTKIFTSTDGSSWTESAVPPGHTYGGPVAYGGGKFVVVPTFPSQRSVLTSPDGVTWTENQNAVPAGPNNVGGYWTDVVYGGGKFVAVATSGFPGYPLAIMSSTDGVTWNE